MKLGRFISIAIFACALAHSTSAATWYVATNGSDSADGTNWATAKATIQAAIDVALSNDTVLVSNGVYATGGRVVYGAMTNRVAITNAITVQSVNGPDVTIIEGAPDPVTTNGDAAVRCVYVGANAVLSGFTLTNGATRTSGDYQEYNGGGVWCETSGIVSNCTLTGNSAYSSGGGSDGGVLNNCIYAGNSADMGGGAAWSTLNNCTLTGNSASAGGGACFGTLDNCTLTDNSAGSEGGGAYGGTLNNCRLVGNSAHDYGGGSSGGTLNNCTLSGNSAPRGGGSYGDTLNNCTLTGNSAHHYGGGSWQGTLNNCILYYNTALFGMNYSESTLRYCCTTPDPGGTGNITNEPQLASASHLSAASPCIGKGSSTYASGTDIDGDPWLNPPSMGCDEVNSGSVTGALVVNAWASHTNVAAGFAARFRTDITGRTTSSEWNFSDGTISSNRPYITHAFVSTGVYDVVLTAFNESYPLGVAVTVTVQVAAQAVHYVNISNATPSAPYTSWATAATNIQDAVDVVSQGGALVLVSNGIYATGGRTNDDTLPNRVVITNGVVVHSVNGPAVTIIKGAGPVGSSAVRCALVGESDVLSGFTLTNGATREDVTMARESSGGRVWCEASGILSNCTLTGNSAFSYGGGSVGGTLNNCTIMGNSAGAGGGSYVGTLNNCTLSGNSGYYGGGSFSGTLNNCIVYFNTASDGPNHKNSTFNYSCTTPAPGGTGNITNQPRFVATNDFHLSADSPCIDRGNNSFAPGTTDLDGNPRILYGVVDMGAYENQAPAGYWAWVLAVTNGLTNLADCATGDGYPNLLKYATGSNPTNSDEMARLSCESIDAGFSLCFNRNTNAPDATLIVERTDSLTNGTRWTGIATNFNGSWGGATNVAEIGTTNPLTVKVQDPSMATNSYLRLHVTRP